jgi:hypothetical protein
MGFIAIVVVTLALCGFTSWAIIRGGGGWDD